MLVDKLALYDKCQLASKNYSNLEVKDFYKYLKEEYNTNIGGLRDAIVEYLVKRYPNFYWASQLSTTGRIALFEIIGPGLISLYFRYVNKVDLKDGVEVFQWFNKYNRNLYGEDSNLYPITISFNVRQGIIYIKNGLNVLSRDIIRPEEKIPNPNGKDFTVIFKDFPNKDEEQFISWLIDCDDIIASNRFEGVYQKQIPLLIEILYLYLNSHHYNFSDKDVYSLIFIIISQRYGYKDFIYDVPKIAEELTVYNLPTNSMFDKFFDISKLSDVSRLFKMLKEIYSLFNKIEEEEEIYSSYIFTDWLKTKDMGQGLVELKKAFAERLHYALETTEDEI